MRQAIVENPSISGFRSADELPAETELAVEGTVPDWLRGRMVHTGPALFELQRGAYAHWFDGLAMLVATEVGPGRVTYRSRFLGSEAYRLAREAGAPVLGEFETLPKHGRLRELVTMLRPPHPTDNANVNIVDLGGRVIAMTESSRHIELDPRSLETRGELRYDDALEGQLSTAHPHVDRDAGVLHNLLIRFGRKPVVQLYEQQLGTITRRLVASLPTDQPSYTHTFAMSERFAIVTEVPLVVNPLKLRFSARPYIERYDWRPERGTRIRVVRKRDGEVVASAMTEPCFVFHHVNAVEHDGRIDIDLLAYPDPSIVGELALDVLRRGGTAGTATFVRLTIRDDEHDQRVDPVELVPDRIELPRIDPRHERRPYRYVYGVGNADRRDFLDRIVRVDLERRTSLSFARDGWYMNEPLFVPAPGAQAEDDGVVLCTVLDVRAGASRLVILDASSLEPIAEARLPQIVPFYFHGQWLEA